MLSFTPWRLEDVQIGDQGPLTFHTMVIRSRATRPQREPEFAYNDDKSRDKTHRAQAVVVPLAVLLILAVILAIGRIVFNFGTFSKYPTIPDNTVRIDEHVGLLLDFRKAVDGKNVTLGPHKATLFIAKPCKEPRFVMRLVGEEALYSIPIVQIDEFRWNGGFQIPFPGLYVVDSRWYGCDASQQTKGFKAEQITIVASGHRETTNVRLTPSYTSIPHLIPEGFWASPKLYSKMPNKGLWKTRVMGSEQPHFMTSSTRLGVSLVAKEATPVHGRFGDLSNYELLCWVGSASAAITRDSFLSILPSVAKQQRPFKFHYYPMDDFRNPDDGWETEYKLKFRKCKILIVSVDELKNVVSQDDYKLQVSTFLLHLVKMFDDETFPIWMLTVNLSSISNASSMCTRPKRRTNHHPCNDALFDLFGASNAFPDRVRLLDNTDLTDPLLDEGLQDAVAVIAMRIFAIAGQQVNTWRKSGQRGTKQGLIRNGKLEPNVVFTVYEFNS
ncbi:hypothetical protein MHU86_571 [Fragilaria crotonensis]|nr:hypothetical protein MHU86_571 [Fragilaria crotonensis]